MCVNKSIFQNFILNYLIHSEFIRIHTNIFWIYLKICTLLHCCTLPHCQTAAHCHTAAHRRAHTLPFTAALRHIAALPNSRTLLPNSRTLPRALPNSCTLPCALPHTAARTAALWRLWPGKREGVTRVWVKAKMAVYMLLESVGRSPYRWEAPTDCALGGTLHMRVRLWVRWRRDWRESWKDYAVKRGTPFCTGQLRVPVSCPTCTGLCLLCRSSPTCRGT